MPQPSAHTTAHTATAKQARLLLDLRLRPLLRALVAAPAGGISVGELVAALGAGAKGWSMQRVHYQVGKLQGAGIVREVAQEARAGRAIRRYMMPPLWFIPFKVTDAATLENFRCSQILPRTAQILSLQTGQLLSEKEEWGLWLQGEGLALGHPAWPPPDYSQENLAFVSSIVGARLKPERAEEFKRRLWALLEEFGEAAESGGEDYTLSLQFVRGRVE